MTFKLAALILAHEKPKNLEKLITDLRARGIIYFVHLDAKSRIRDFAASDNILKERISVRWGAFSQVSAMLTLMRAGIEDKSVTHSIR